MLVIRMSRVGSKKRPYFRVVVADSRKARDSRVVEVLGYYHPKTRPARVHVDRERYAHWVKAGAQPSDTVRTLLARHATAPVAAGGSSAGSVAPAVESATASESGASEAAGQ